MKRFYNNTLMSGAFSKALRVIALLCVLMGVSTSALGTTYYLWYGSNYDYNNANKSYKWSDGVEFSNNKGTFNITTTYSECYVYIAKTNKNISSLLKSPNFSVSTSTNVKNLYQGNRDGYQRIQFSTGTSSNKSFTIECDFSNSSEYKFKVNTGGGSETTCTPSTTITEAVYDASTGKVTLKGNFTTCGTKNHGFQWRKIGSDWCPQNKPTDYSDYISFNTDKDGEVTAEFTATKGVNYEFRTYIVPEPITDPWIYSTTPTYVSTTSSTSGCITVYLKPNANWKADNPRFAAYFWKDSDTNINEWIDMKFANECGEDYYYCTVPDGKDKVIFCRMNPSATANNWNNKWNQSADLTVPTDDNTQWAFPETIYDGYAGSWTAPECDQTDCQEITPDIPEVTYNSEVLLTYEPEYDEETKEAKVYAYFKINPGVDECTNISQYGFAYCKGYGCRPEELVNGNHIVVGTSDLSRGEEFNATLTGLDDNAVYGYRGYIANGDNIIFSDETRYFSTGACIPVPGGGDTIRVTVDATKETNECKLIFNNFQTAIDKLKGNSEYCVNGNLRQPVVISVAQKEDNGSYSGKDQTVSGGNDGASQTLTVNVISGFNKGGIGYDEKNVLIVRANNGDKPRLEHLLIRSSKNVIIEGINIISNPADNGKTKDTALEIDDGNSSNWEGGTCTLPNANITVRNCMIGSNGFTGMHVNGVGNLVFENNVFNLSYDIEGADDKTKENIIGWGASVKFLECKDIKFVRNNLWGAHNTTLWLQQIENALFYNNVFWNNNTIAGNTRTIRIYKQYNGNNQITPKHIAFLYNTFYVKDGSTTKDHTFDFISSECAKSDQCHDIGSVTFLYNNCYSYDPDLGKKSSSWKSKFNATNNHFCPNNFWSKYDFNNNKPTSVFELESCDDAEFINVSNYLCETSITGPASLVVKQPEDASDAGLKKATPLTVDKVKGYSNIQNITDVDIKADRYRKDIRKGNKWTYGAYEATSSNAVNTIYWVGGYSSDWDYRANWSWINSDGIAQQLSCVDNLNENLKIVIPRRYSNSGYPVSTTGKYFYPEIPENFSSDARQAATKDEEKDLPSGIPASEQVSAGRGYVEPTKYADFIELEYGAAITGVERLAAEGVDPLYREASVGFVAPRNQWILVGTVIRPWDDKLGEYRDLKSGDYFVEGQLPHVYMHQVKLDDSGNASWDETFPSLEVPVPVQSIFAIRINDEYGPYKLPAEFYNSWYGGNYDPTEPIKYDNFIGKFVNESSLPVYDVKAGPNLLNNSYPCCIDPKKIPSEVGTVLCYDYAANSFKSPNGFERKEVLINPQHGFIFTPATTNTTNKFEVTKEMFVGADTRSRSAKIELPTLSLNLYNANTLVDNSNIVIRVDEMLGEEESLANTPKVFAPNAGTPELYIIANDKMYTTYDVNSSSQVIPLGVKLKKDMNITFKKMYSEDFDNAILVDTYTGREYDLLERSYTTEPLVAGVIEGRFFLNLGVSEDTEDDKEEGDDNVSTNVGENSAEKAINIFVTEDNAIRVVTNNAELKAIYVSDMTGRTMKYSVKGYAASLKLPVAQGAYLINVIAENATRSEKVILK